MTTGPDHDPIIDEQLSAWLDDELPTDELEFLASRLTRSPEHQARLARYSLIGSSLRGGHRGSQGGNLQSELVALRLTHRVRTVLEASVITPQHVESGRMTRLLPYAVAAGVALVALLTLLRPVVGPPDPEPVAGDALSLSTQSRVLIPTADRVPNGVGGEHRASLSQQRLTNYLVYHGEYSGMLSAKLTESHIVNHRPYAAALQVVDRSPVQ